MADPGQPAAHPAQGELEAPGLAGARVADMLREQILEGHYLPGTALRETAVAAALHASRNTVREAFRLLAHDGLVRHERHRGVAVRRLTEADVADIYRVRRALQRLGLEQTARRPDGPAVLAALVGEAEQAAERGDWPTVATADLRFHQAIVASLDSPRLDELCRRLLAELRLGFAAMPDAASFHRPYLARNRQLVDLLAAGDVERCVKELDDYLTDAERQITEALRTTRG